MKTLSLLLCSLFCMQILLANPSNCDNVNDPGRIYHNQSSDAIVKFCAAWQPAPINETFPASGGSGGAIQYQWQYQRENGNWNDIDIPEGQSNELNLGQSNVIQYLNNNGISNSHTVSFRRGARRPACTDYGYSNEVLYQVYPNVSDEVDAIQAGIFCDYPSDEHCLSIGLGNAHGVYEFLWRFSYDNENWIYTSTEVPADYCYTSGTTAYISAGSRLIGSPCDFIFKPSLEVITHRTPELNVEIVPLSCQGENDGEILVSDISGNNSSLTGLYVYSINNGQNWQSNPRFTGLSEGSYTIQVQTQFCNSYSINTILTASPSPELDDIEIADESDCGNNDGSIRISLLGGTGGFEYRLSTTPWQNSPNFDNLSAGSYDLYARNQDGSCEIDIGSVNIQGPSSPILSHIAVSPISDCGVNNGQIQIQASSGQGPLSYTIDDGASWSNSAVFNSLSAGQYEVGVRNQDGTCELYQSVFLDAPTAPIIESVSSQNPSNCGSSNGQISIQANGQGSSLQYTIDGGANWSAQNNFTGLPAGLYEIRVRKIDGTCLIHHASLVELSAPSSPEVSTIEVDQPSDCGANDGEIRIYPSSSDWHYSIDGGNTWQEGSGIFPGLSPGSYKPYIRNGDGTCPTTAGAAIELNYPNQPIIVSIDYSNPTDWCITDGYLSINATGGEGPLEYTRNGINWQSSPEFLNGLGAATLIPGVRNADGSCEVFFPEAILIDFPDRPSIEEIIDTPDSGCGANDGSIYITATDGIGEFDYSIDGGNSWQSSPLFADLSSGNYDIAIRNKNGSCNITDDVYIPQLLPPQITDIDIQYPSDCGLADALINIVGDRGTGDFQFTIDAGQTWSSGSTFTGLAPGDYWLGIRNSTGYCEEYESTAVIISERPHKVISEVDIEQPSDCDTDDGKITLFAQGNGVSEYSIDGGDSWQSSRTFRDLPPGIYEPMIRNTDGTCQKTYGESFTLNYPPRPIFEEVMAEATSDCGVSDGSIEVIAGEGIGSFQYSLNDGNSWQNSSIFTGLNATTYGKLAIRNSDGTCYEEYDGSVQISQPPKPTFGDIDIDQPSDCNLDDGTIQISAAGGLGSYQYTFDGGSSWQAQYDLNSLEPGAYNLGIRNSNGTCPVYNNGPIQLSYPPEPTIADIDFQQPSNCNTNDGSISIQATNGTGNFQYSIDGGNSWKNNGNFNNLQPGDYEIAVQNSNGTCFILDNQTIELEYPPEPTISDIDFLQPSNCDTNDGSISIQAANGTGNFQYSIDGGNSWKNNGNFNNLQPGDYEIAVQNSNGTCFILNNQTIELEYPPEPTIADIDFQQPSDCNTNDGSISIQAANGTGNFQYSIDGGNSWKNNGNFNNLQPGNYEITVRNSNGTCSILDHQAIELEYPPEPTIADIDFQQPSDCNTNDGSISIQAANGTGNFQFSIDGGNSWKNNGNFNNLQPGDYEIAVQNSNGTCFILDNQTIELEYPPEPTIVDIDFQQPSDCNINDGSISIQAANGTGNFQYSIDGGNSWKNNGNFNNLQPGDYEIAVQNSNGTCFILDNQTIELEYPPEPNIVDIDFQQPSDCNTNDGSISIQAANGTGNFQYSIDGGSSWKSNGNFNNLQPGDYEIAVQNSNGTCFILNNQSIELEYPPEPNIVDIDFQQPSDCNTNDGSISIQAANGTGNFQFSIDGGNSWKNNGNFNNLQPGNYEITVRNSNGTCSILDNQTIELEYPPEPVIVNFNYDQPSDCDVDDAVVSISGNDGIGSFSFSIDGGSTWQSSNTFGNLSPGIYQIGIANANGTCPVFSSDFIEIAYPAAPEIIDIIDQSPAGCGTSDGYIEVVTVNGLGPTNYSIDNGASWSNNNQFINLAPGVYTIRVQNQNQTCEQIYGEVQLNAPSSPAFNDLTQISPSDCGLENGQIIISATEGIGSYQYSINGGQNWQSNGTFIDLSAGSYTPSIRNGNGTCQVDYQGLVTLDEPEPAQITEVKAEQPTDCELNNGRIEVFIDQTVSGFQFSTDGGSSWQASPIFTNLGPGNYQVGVRKSTGQCEVIHDEIYRLDYPVAPEITSISHDNVSDCGLQDGMLQISAQGGIGNFEYSIDNGQSWFASNQFSNLAAGNYLVGVRNKDQSCPTFADTPITMAEPSAPILQAIHTEQPTDCGAANGQIHIQAAASTGAGLNYSINGGSTLQSSPTFNNLTANTYQVAIRNANGTCESLAPEFTILVEPIPASILAVNHLHPSNCEDNDGTISVVLAGATNNKRFSIDGGQSWQTSPTFDKLPPGNYRIMVSNGDGACIVEYGNQIQLEAPSAPSILAVETQQISDCEVFDAEIRINALAGSDPIHYSIDNGIIWHTDATFRNLSPGVYQVVVSNDNGTCPVKYAETITIAPLSPPEILQVFLDNPTDCGETDGKLEIEAEGFGQEVLYSVDGGSSWKSSPLFERLTPGLYSIAIKYANGTCQVNLPQAVRITAPEAPRILDIFAEASNSCIHHSGSIQIATFPTTGLEFSIDGGNSWSDQSYYDNLVPGSYQISIRLSNGSCQVDALEAIHISAPIAPELQDILVAQPSGCGYEDATIQIRATGTGTLQYSIDGGVSWSPQSLFENLPPGQYQVALQNAANECIIFSDQSIQIIPPSAPEVISISTQSISDCELQDGEITIAATGEGDMEYSLDDGLNWQLNSTFKDLGAGEYHLSVRYIDGSCQLERIETVQITSPIAPAITDVQIEQTSECASPNASLRILTDQEEEDLQYSIDGGDSWHNSSVFTNLEAGAYPVSIRYINSSCQVHAPEVMQITPPVFPEIEQILIDQPTDCEVNDGQISIVSFSNQELQYSIDGGESWSLDSVFTRLTAGSYLVSIRYLDDTCQVDANELVNIEAAESVAITEVIVQQPSNCDSSQASIMILTNTIGELEYSIDNGESWTPEYHSQNLSAGLYNIAARLVGTTCQTTWPETITIHDSSNAALALAELEVQNSTQCQLSNGSVKIITDQSNLLFSLNNGEQWQASPLFSQLSIGDYSLLAQDTISGCTGAIGNFTITGGSDLEIENVGIILPSNCATEDGGIFINPSDSNLYYSIDGGQNWQPNNQFSGLVPGTYFVAVSSQDSSCQTYYEIPVRLSAQNAATIWQVNASIPTRCGEIDATLQVTILEDESSYEFSINDGESWQDTSFFHGLSSGSYKVQVRNKHLGCLSIYHPPIVIPDPPNFVNLMIQEQLPSHCGAQDGSIVINYTNSSSDIEAYSIDGGLSWQSHPLFDSLPGGQYEVRIRLMDLTCELVHLLPINLGFISTNDSLQVEIQGVTGCQDNDGSIRIEPPWEGSYQFSIDRGQTYQDHPIFEGLPSGNYLVRIKDVLHECQYEYPVLVEVPAITPPTIAGIQYNSPSGCAGNGSIEISSLAEGLLEYSIDAGESWRQDSLFTSLSNGEYQVAIRYANGSCPTAYPEVIVLTDTSMNTTTEIYWERSLCLGESIQVGDSVFNEAGSYQITIQGENTCDSLIFLSIITDQPVTTNLTATICDGEYYELGGLIYSEAGLYQNILHSVHGCDSIINLQLSVNQIDTTGFSILLCEGENFQYGSNFLTEAGSYTFHHQGTLGCDSIVIVDLDFIPSPSPAEWQVVMPTSCQAENGSIQIVNSSPTLLYSLDNGLNWQNQGQFAGLGNGIYQLLIRDVQTNCIRLEEIPVHSISVPQIDTILVDPGMACQGVNGQITFQMMDTSQLYLYSIDAGQTWQKEASFFNLNAGLYPLYVSSLDSSCAYFVQNTQIQASDSVQIEILTTGYDYCHPDSSGVISAYVTQGSSPYEYQWSNGSNLPEIDQLSAGDYALTITDSRGCQDSLSIHIADHGPSIVYDSLLQDTFYLCKGEVLELTVPREEFNYRWTSTNGFSAEGNEIQIEAGGQYVLTAISLEGCEITDSFLVVEGTDYFQANFLLPNAGLINTSIYAVEVSWPIPSRVNWITDHSNIREISTYLNQTELQFTAPGNYGVKMEAQLGDCIQQVEKFITIYTDPDSLPTNSNPIHTGAILDFSLFPNPNDGNFELLAEFSDVQAGQMRIYNDVGLLIEARDLSGWASYRENFLLSTAVAGNYIAVLQTQFEHRTLNFIIQ